jgi:hypothetical protein
MIPNIQNSNFSTLANQWMTYQGQWSNLAVLTESKKIFHEKVSKMPLIK